MGTHTQTCTITSPRSPLLAGKHWAPADWPATAVDDPWATMAWLTEVSPADPPFTRELCELGELRELLGLREIQQIRSTNAGRPVSGASRHPAGYDMPAGRRPAANRRRELIDGNHRRRVSATRRPAGDEIHRQVVRGAAC